MIEHKRDFQSTFDLLQDLRKTRLTRWLDEGPSPEDPFKLWLSTSPRGYTGYDLAMHLEKYGIIVEFSHTYGTLLYLSVLNSEEDLLRICEALDHLEDRPALASMPFNMYPNPIKYLSREQVKEATTKKVSIERALGHICAQNIVPYPPGVPLIVPGEVIQEAHISLLEAFLPNHCVFGISSGELTCTYEIEVVD